MTQPIPLGEAYPFPNRAMLKQGGNIFLQYQPNEQTNINLSAGWQNSMVQKAYSENFATPLTTASSVSRYADLRFTNSKLLGQFSFQNGIQEEGLGSLGQTWVFQSIDGVLEYDFRIKNLSIKPGINYRTVYYDDTPFVNVALKTGQFNGRRDINTFAGYLRTDYFLLQETLRLGAAVRGDLFNYPNQPYFSYQFTANYKIDAQNQIRLVYGRAYRSANIIFTYADRFLENFNGAGVALEVAGNRDLKLLRTDMIELGWRGKIAQSWILDVEIFYNATQNYADFLYGDTYTRNGVQQIQPFSTQNIPLKTTQMGLTISVNYVKNNWQIKPFLTYQQTTLQNSSLFNNTQNAIFSPTPDPNTNNINANIGKKEEHKGTPAFFGGLFLNYKLGQFNFNLNPYFFSQYTFFAFQNANYPDGRGNATIPAKFLLNAKISYFPIKSFSTFINVRNALGTETAEFYNTDLIGRMFLGGVSFNF
jgi:iron complex outermembrane receptor protein